MLHEAKDLLGYSVHADGDAVGSVHDLYFDDERWFVRYLLVKAGGTIPAHRVLLPPGLVEEIDDGSMFLYEGSYAAHVENAPGVEAVRPAVARQEAERHRAAPYRAGRPALTPRPAGESPLRSMGEVEGYRVRSLDGEIGQVADLVVDDEGWAIRYVVIDTRNWLPGKKVLVPARWVTGVSRADAEADAEVRVDVDSIEVKEAPALKPDAPIDQEYEEKLHRHYGRPPYWLRRSRTTLTSRKRKSP
jgi:uncharacterized protein YrrD